MCVCVCVCVCVCARAPAQLYRLFATVAARLLCPWDLPGKNPGVAISSSRSSDPGMGPLSLVSLASAGRFFTASVTAGLPLKRVSQTHTGLVVWWV